MKRGYGLIAIKDKFQIDIMKRFKVPFSFGLAIIQTGECYIKDIVFCEFSNIWILERH